MKELSFLEGWGGGVIHAYKISLPFAFGPSLQYHAERAGSHVDWVGLLSRNRHCWPENVGSCWLVLVVVYKLVQQLPTMLGAAVHYAVILIN